jgi:predicted regulator of Ras-like GTPase activity (Roadblock/LC7/MglB family)
MALVGDLKEISIATLIQLNCVEKNTAQLTVSTPKGPATVYLDKGEIIDASYAGTRGEEAIYRVLSLSEGEFRVAEVTDLPDRTIAASWQSLLLEGMRVLDETKRGKAQVAETVGNYLDNAPDVESYLIASKNGDVFATNCEEHAEKLAGASVLLAWKGQELSSRLALGEMSFARVASGKTLTFFLDCGELVAAIVTKKAAVLGPLNALLDDVRKKLRYVELNNAHQGIEVVA